MNEDERQRFWPMVSKRALAYTATSDRKAQRHLLTMQHNGTRTVLLWLRELGLLTPPSDEAVAAASSSSSSSSSSSVQLQGDDARHVELGWSALSAAPSDALQAQRRWLTAHAPSGYFGEVFKELDECLGRAFDQYAGLRQIGDLRGLPRHGAALFSAAQPVVRSLQSLADAAVVFVMSRVYALMSSTPQSGVALMRAASLRGDAAFAALAAEFEPCLAAIVASVGCLRSKLVVDGASGANLNDAYQRRFIQAVIEATGQHERVMRDRLAAAMADVDQCAESVRTRIYADAGGRNALLQRADDSLDGLRPWAIEWLKVQKDAFQMREVFADTEDALRRVLDQSLAQMLAGFNECLTQGVVAVLIPFEDDIAKLRGAVAQHRRVALGQ